MTRNLKYDILNNIKPIKKIVSSKEEGEGVIGWDRPASAGDVRKDGSRCGKGGVSVKVRIHLKATVTDLVQAERYRQSTVNGRFTADDGRVLSCEEIADACGETMEYHVIGDYERENDRVTISYAETPDFGFAATTSLIFNALIRGYLSTYIIPLFRNFCFI